MKLVRRLGELIVDALICLLIPAPLWRAMCQRTTGHAFTTDVLHTDDQASFVIDPTVRCTHCKAPMSSDVYACLTAAYAAALLDEEAW